METKKILPIQPWFLATVVALGMNFAMTETSIVSAQMFEPTEKPLATPSAAQLKNAQVLNHYRLKGGSEIIRESASEHPWLKEQPVPQDLSTLIGPIEVPPLAGEEGRMYTEPVNFESCAISKDDRVERSHGLSKASQKTTDILFVRSEDVKGMTDAFRYFGEDVILMPVARDTVSFTSLAAQGIGAPCLPFRIRSGKFGVVKYEGLAALGRFDGEALRGKLHKDIKARFKGVYGIEVDE